MNASGQSPFASIELLPHSALNRASTTVPATAATPKFGFYAPNNKEVSSSPVLSWLTQQNTALMIMILNFETSED